MQGFKEIGLMDFYDIIKESAKRMGHAPENDRLKRQKQMEKYKPNFDDLDKKFYKLEENMDSKLLGYIKKNKEKFYFKGLIKKARYN